MAGDSAPDRLRRSAAPSQPPRAVLLGVTVLAGPNGRARPAAIARGAAFGRRAIVALALAGALAAGLIGWLERGHVGRPPVNVMARQRGAAGVAAAYGHPLACLSITTAPVSRTYARADFNHASPCGRYTGYPTAIFHYASGAWRPVLEAVVFGCPVESLPVAVQRELAVCL